MFDYLGIAYKDSDYTLSSSLSCADPNVCFCCWNSLELWMFLSSCQAPLLKCTLQLSSAV